MKDNRDRLTNHVLATSGLGFNLSTEDEKPNDTIFFGAKYLMHKNQTLAVS